MATKNKIHDKYYRNTMSDLRIARDFFNVHLPEKIKEKVNLDTLKIEKTDFITPKNFVTEEQEEKIVDMLYSVDIAGKEGYFYNLCEQQSTARRDMPLRLMRYMLEIIAYDVKKQKGKGVKEADIEYPIIIPMVMYNGRVPYACSTSFFDMYQKDYKDLALEIMTNPFQLIDLNSVDDKNLRGHIWASILEFAMQANTRKFHDDFESLLQKLAAELVKIENERDGDDIIESAICYVLDVADTRKSNPRDCLEIIAKEFSEKNRSKIMSAADRLKDEGRQEGMEKGIEKGVKKTALNMLKKNMDVDTISEVTELPIDQIEELKAQNQDYFDEKK